MKKNNVSGADTATRKSISLTESPGVYDKNPDPGLSQYGRSTGGPNEIPTKFGESIGLPTNRNARTSAVPERGNQIAQKATTSRINNKPNRYDSAVKKTSGF